MPRLAPPYPRKALPPDETGHWIAINGDAWPFGAESEHLIPTHFIANETVVNDPSGRRFNLKRSSTVF